MTESKKFISQFLWRRMKMVFCGRMSASSGMLYAGKNTGRGVKNTHEVIELYLEEQKEEIVEQLDTI